MSGGLPLRSRRCRFWLGAVALAAFALRALIPMGYMLAPVEGQARLVMCPGGMHLHGQDMAGMQHAPSDAPAADTRHGLHSAPIAEHCPFALAGGASLLAGSAETAVPYFSLLQPKRPPIIDSVSTAPPLRYHAPRGPPSPA